MTDIPRDLDRGAELPPFYSEDRLVLLARDPYSIFAYWELSLSTEDRLRKSWDEEPKREPTLLLRIYKCHLSRQKDVENFFDIPVNYEANSWYISVNNAGRTYHAELGYLKPDKSFFAILRSNYIQTPRDSISDLIDEEWQLPDWKARKLFRRISVCHLSSPELLWRKKQPF